jgi:hypothetical protein
MKQSASKESNSFSATQEVLPLIWNTKVHHHIHNSASLVPNMGQTNPVQGLSSYLYKIHFNILLPSMRRSSRISWLHFQKYAMDGHTISWFWVDVFEPVSAAACSGTLAALRDAYWNSYVRLSVRVMQLEKRWTDFNHNFMFCSFAKNQHGS